MRAFLADAVLVIHFALASFIALGVVAIWLGIWRRWRWILSFRLRLLHLAAIGFVALEGMLGIACPLTVWESWLRQDAGERSFVGRWVQRALYYDLPEWFFVAIYVSAAAITALAWIIAPPQRGATPKR